MFSAAKHRRAAAIHQDLSDMVSLLFYNHPCIAAWVPFDFGCWMRRLPVPCRVDLFHSAALAVSADDHAELSCFLDGHGRAVHFLLSEEDETMGEGRLVCSFVTITPKSYICDFIYTFILDNMKLSIYNQI